MANSARGEVTIDLNGKSYTLHAGTNALVELEELFSTPGRRVTWQEVIRLAEGVRTVDGKYERQSFTHIRGLIWAMTRRHHREMKLDDVGDLIDSVGMESIDVAFTQALRQMLPDEADLKALGIDPANPPQAQPKVPNNGTGRGSSRKRGKSD